MGKSFYQNAESTSVFLSPPPPRTDERVKDVGTRTQPLRSARIIDINMIIPDPDQPRKTFNQESLESLAESISELDGIIDPITVEYVEKDDCYRIVSGERRYRAAKMVGLIELPCIVKEVDAYNRFLMQFIANLQREDIQPLEEAAGIRQLLESYGYNQLKVAKLLNKSKSYISQVLGLERLGKPARKIIRSASIPKEAQIQASRETDPAKQKDILIEASEAGKTIREIRKKGAAASQNDRLTNCGKEKATKAIQKQKDLLIEWSWEPPDKSFKITIKFVKTYHANEKIVLLRNALRLSLMELEKS